MPFVAALIERCSKVGTSVCLVVDGKQLALKKTHELRRKRANIALKAAKKVFNRLSNRFERYARSWMIFTKEVKTVLIKVWS